MKRLHLACACLLSASLIPALPLPCPAAVLTADTSWEGLVDMSEDVMIPKGIVLTVKAGTVIRAAVAEDQRTDPEYLSPLVELTVRGTLRVEGTVESPVVFTTTELSREPSWAGIMMDGGDAAIRNARIEGAETGIHHLEGKLELIRSELSDNRYGMVLQGPKSLVRGAGNVVASNDFGLIVIDGADAPAGLVTGGANRKKQSMALKLFNDRTLHETSATTDPPATRRYEDKVLIGETIWQGKVTVDGTVRVPEGSRLVILPGTTVEFTRKDTNGDGIGENGLMIQGLIIAKGSPAAPITFRGAFRGVRGSWDAINIMNSAGMSNLIEHCRIEDAYRGIHFHFSKVAVTGSTFTNCYRGIQFQESDALLRDNRLIGNRSAIQARDSQIVLKDNTISGNTQGLNLFRNRLTATGNIVVANAKEGVKIREGATLFEGNTVAGNRYGILAMGAFHGAFRHNALTGNGETGLSLKDTDNIEISGNFISGNGINGLNLQGAGGRISDNLFSDNGERGIGIQSFSGIIERNNFTANGTAAIEVEGTAHVAAPMNWWGSGVPDKAILDGEDDPAKGKVEHRPQAAAPFRFHWPLPEVAGDLTWRGEVAIAGTVTVPTGNTLTVSPQTKVLFGPAAGLAVRGRIRAEGKPDGMITFTSTGRKEAGAWGEILLEHADGSSFTHAIIEYATWGIHSHFSRLDVNKSILRHNHGGIRFRSGPLMIDSCRITGNTIGIRDYRGTAVVRGSAITGNETGVFVREEGGGLTLTGNNLSANSKYNLRLGDFNTEDVPAGGNWWGTTDPAGTIFDGRREPGIGIALLDPVVPDQLQLDLPDGGR